MTITEAINKLNRRKVFDADCGEAIEIVVNELLSIMAELKWYREQDLVRRKDAIREGTIVLRDLTDIDAIACKGEVEYRMKQIPKAEPPYGDCETCKHYYRQGELTYGFCADCIERGMGKYEPYIPTGSEGE